jgi:nitrate reductase cytochrome c-type subunit
MSSKQASPLTGALILAGFIALGMTVLFTVRAKLQSKGHESDGAHHASWATVHAEPHAVAEAVEQPRVLLTAHQSNPRPGAKTRTLKQYYSRRAYPGAPPVIPHEVVVDGVINDDCLDCHEDGGYDPAFEAYTPITPHPEMENCRQCHVSQLVENEFVETEWIFPELPKRGRQAIPGGPLLIPHSLQMRENCLACHAGPHAVVEIKTSHPERQNCQQCHVPDRDIPPFQSKIDTRMELADAEQ